MFTLHRRLRSLPEVSPTTHFAHCVSRAKTTARGFWAWIPVPIELPVARLAAPSPSAGPASGASSYGETIVAAAARVYSPT